MIDRDKYLVVSEHGFLLQLEKGNISRCDQYAGMYYCALSGERMESLDDLPDECPINNGDPRTICPIVWLLTCYKEGLVDRNDVVAITDGTISLDDFSTEGDREADATPMHSGEPVEELARLEEAIASKRKELESLENGAVSSGSNEEWESRLAELEDREERLKQSLQELEDRERELERRERLLKDREREVLEESERVEEQKKKALRLLELVKKKDAALKKKLQRLGGKDD